MKPTWVERLAPRPLCDVPWLGRAVVLSDGKVNFCCFSDAIVGNVNETSFAEIWRGEAMGRIRGELAQQRFPPECRSNSCPLFRGDRHTYLLDRMDGHARSARSGGDDPHAGVRARLSGTRLVLGSHSLREGGNLRADLELRCDGPWLAADLFAAVTFPDGAIRFLPEFVDFPLPLAQGIGADRAGVALRVPLIDQRIDDALPAGRYELCVALVVQETNPSVLANCYDVWREDFTISLRPRAAIPGEPA